MYNYSIMPLDTEHIEEICQDIRYQYENRIADCALFMMTLVPEGNPVIDKASILCEKYDLFRNRLEEMSLECGILVQATIGHGYVLDKLFPFQQYIGMADGKAEYICCPYDEGFRQHFYHQMAIIAAHKPKLIMVDDDFRLMGERAGQGCACSLHRNRIRELTGENLSQEELRERIYRQNDAYIKEVFVETQKESLLGAAKIMRDGIDSVDPSIQGAFCACGDAAECAFEIATILAGKGNPSIVRINNGNYAKHGNHGFSVAMYRAASQIQHVKKADAILAETDTCPQNRYSTSAYQLHAHYTGTILEGASGAKHWITRLHAFEPGSGRMYRKLLGKYAGYYRTLADLVPKLIWMGCRIPVASSPEYLKIDQTKNGWYYHVLERIGLPMYFSAENTGAAFLDGDADRRYSDEELVKVLNGTVFLSSETAYRIVQRGYAEALGVDVRPWKGEHPSMEVMYLNRNECAVQMGIHELIPLNEKVEVHSMVMHVPDGKSQIALFPGVTRYTNAYGGTVVVFCGTPKAEFVHNQAFSFLCESRKQQLVQLLKESGNLPVWYTEDAEVYLRAAKVRGTNAWVVALFNIGMDPLETIPLGITRDVTCVEYLLPDGGWSECPFEKNSDGIQVFTEARIMDPVILRIQ